MRDDEAALRARASQLESDATNASIGRNDYAGAIALNLQCAEVARTLGDVEMEMRALLRCGECCNTLGQLERALGFYGQVRKLAQTSGQPAAEADALIGTSAVFAQQRRNDEALAAIREGVRLALTCSKPDIRASRLDAAAYACRWIGAFELGLSYLDQSEALWRAERNLGALGSSLSLRKILYKDMHLIARALETALQTIAVYEKAGDRARALHESTEIARLYMEMGTPEKALLYLQNTLDAANRQEHGDVVAWVLLLQADAYQALGRDDLALDSNRQALERYRERGDMPRVVGLLGNQATLWLALGRRDTALAAAREAHATARTLGDRRLEAEQLVKLAKVHAQRGEPAPARRTHLQALAILRAVGDRMVTGDVLVALAETDPPALARRRYREALALYDESGSPLEGSGLLAALGDLERREGRDDAAEAAYRDAIARVEQRRARAGQGMSDQGTLFEKLSGPYRGYLQLLVGQGRGDEAFVLAQKTKARGLLDLMVGGRVDLNGRMTADERADERKRVARCDALAAEMVREAALNEPGSKRRFDAAKRALAAAERELEIFRDALYARYPGLSARRGTATATRQQIAAALPDGAALLEFVALDAGRFAVFVVDRGPGGRARVTLHRLDVAGAVLERQIRALRDACAKPDRPWQAPARALHRTLLEPVAARLRGKTQLVVCPDQALWDVPFGVLLDASGTPLLERHALSGANSATTWHAAKAGRKPPSPHPRMLVLANPAFEAERRFGASTPRPITVPDRPITVPDRPITVPDRPITVPDRPITVPDRDVLLPRSTRLNDLPGTQREADALARRFPDAVVHTRAAAQESILKREAHRFQRLHLASHAFVNDAAPLLSSIVLANPEPGSGDDGFLTAREIVEMDLSSTEMVVLSACRTAGGARRPGDGIVGLTWALFAAGCPTQVVSQWAVDDASTAILMSHFYAELAGGASTGAALQRAARATRKNPRYAHPYFWAPFLLMGDPR